MKMLRATCVSVMIHSGGRGESSNKPDQGLVWLVKLARLSVKDCRASLVFPLPLPFTNPLESFERVSMIHDAFRLTSLLPKDRVRIPGTL